MQHRYEHLQWQQNRSKATMWQLYEFQLFRGAKKSLVDWRLCVACYYPTTSTYYPSTTRGIFVGPPVAENIDICGYLWFLLLSELYGYNMPLTTFLVKEEFLLHRPVLIFQSQWTPEQAIIIASSVRTILVSWEKCAVAQCLRICGL